MRGDVAGIELSLRPTHSLRIGRGHFLFVHGRSLGGPEHRTDNQVLQKATGSAQISLGYPVNQVV